MNGMSWWCLGGASNKLGKLTEHCRKHSICTVFTFPNNATWKHRVVDKDGTTTRATSDRAGTKSSHRTECGDDHLTVFQNPVTAQGTQEHPAANAFSPTSLLVV